MDVPAVESGKSLTKVSKSGSDLSSGFRIPDSYCRDLLRQGDESPSLPEHRGRTFSPAFATTGKSREGFCCKAMPALGQSRIKNSRFASVPSVYSLCPPWNRSFAPCFFPRSRRQLAVSPVSVESSLNPCLFVSDCPAVEFVYSLQANADVIEYNSVKPLFVTCQKREIAAGR